ncbi:MAG: glycosyltransferase family 39 protein [Frankia sp.]
MLAGLAIRLGYLFGWQNPGHDIGDSYYYHYGANLFASGRGFPNPFELRQLHHYWPDAQHPPLTIVLLAIPSLFRLRSYFDHQVFSCLLGTVTVGVIGLTGRRMAGPRAGLFAAALAAVYPGLWLNDPMVLSETPSVLVCALTLLLCYRFIARRTVARAAWLGVVLAADILVRAELALLAVVLVAPLILLNRALPWRARLVQLGAAAATCLVLLAPWVGYNLSRFSQPEYISTGLGSTLIVANCDPTYHAPLTGWWFYGCGVNNTPPGDMSDRDVGFRHQAFTYISDHSGELPRVIAARVGRLWGFYAPNQQLRLDQIEERQITFDRVGLWTLYAFQGLSVVALVVLRRRRVSVWPPVALVVTVTFSAAIIYGTTRFRAAAEPALVLLAAVAIDAAIGVLVASRRGPRDPTPGSAPGSTGRAPGRGADGADVPAAAAVVPAATAAIGAPKEVPAG